LTCEAVHELCLEYLDDKYLNLRDEIDELRMYCN
jgi:hypothetical protein